jgi:hypothetical protein
MAFTRKADIRSKQLASTLTIGESVFLLLLQEYIATRKPSDTITDLINATLAAREAMLNNLNP